MKVFSIKQALLYGFKSSLRHLIFLISLMAIVIVAGLLVASAVLGTTSLFFISRLPEACAFIQKGILPNTQELAVCLTSLLDLFASHWLLYTMVLALGFFVMYLTLCYLSLGWFKSLLHVYDYKKGSFRTLIVHPRLVFTFTIASILCGIIVALGMVAFVIPGIIFAIMFSMIGYVIVDKKAGIIESFRMSAHITHGARWRLFLLILTVALISLLLLPLDTIEFLRYLRLPNMLVISLLVIGTLLRIYLSLAVTMMSVYAYRTLNAQTYAPVQQ